MYFYRHIYKLGGDGIEAPWRWDFP